jgi:hypothetical protein
VFDGIGKYLASEDDVLLFCIFRIVMTNTGDAGYEQHPRWQMTREDLRIVDSGARHPYVLTRRVPLRRPFERVLEFRVHCMRQGLREYLEF